MTSLIIQFTGLALGVAIAGTFLARSADRIAELTGLGRLIIGSLLLAAVTSLPELTVDIAAVRAGLTDIAVGDLFGSSLMNLFILACLDLAWRGNAPVFKRNVHASRPRKHTMTGYRLRRRSVLVGAVKSVGWPGIPGEEHSEPNPIQRVLSKISRIS